MNNKEWQSIIKFLSNPDYHKSFNKYQISKLERIHLVKAVDPLVSNPTYVLNLKGKKYIDYKPEDQEEIDIESNMWKTFKEFIMDYFGQHRVDDNSSMILKGHSTPEDTVSGKIEKDSFDLTRVLEDTEGSIRVKRDIDDISKEFEVGYDPNRQHEELEEGDHVHMDKEINEKSQEIYEKFGLGNKVKVITR